MKTYLLPLIVVILCFVSGVFYSQGYQSLLPLSENTIPDRTSTVQGSTCAANQKEKPKHIEDPAKTENKWVANAYASLSFIENKGQFDERDKTLGSSILYAIDDNPTLIFFTKQGVSYRFDRKFKNPNRKKGDPTKPKKVIESDYVRVNWIGANPNVEILAEGQVPHTYTYAVLAPDRSREYEHAGLKGYQKLVYKDLYPNIDVEYVVHPEGGIKYSMVLHPGADIANVKIQYPEGYDIKVDEQGRLVIATSFGNIIEHAPITFYAGNTGSTIASKYILNGKTVTFELGAYDKSQTVVIDPWVQSPTLGNAHCLWECDKDAAGNVYVIGGDSPMKLQKYNNSGVLQWTYNTPWDTANNWLGTLATDFNGNSYVTSGSVAAMRKISTTGTVTWTWNAGLFSSDEYWTISFNCDQTMLVVGGTTTTAGGLGGCIFNINTSNGNVINKTNVGVNSSALRIDECRSISSSKNAKYYYLTLDKIGAISQDLTICSSDPIFEINHGYTFSYKSENYRPNNGNGGICAIKANDQFVYTHNGATVHKRSLIDGSIITSATIPGGVNTVSFGQSQPENSGIDVDECGNVYVGSSNQVVKYGPNLNLISSVNTSFKVYDVAVSNGGEIVVSGGTGNPNSASRAGFVQVINMSACAPFTLVCCNATICPAGPYCTTDPPVTLQSAQPGGVWSGTGITNPATGVFSPAAAGPGTHTIVYSLPCGTDTIYIDVTICATLQVCIETNGQLTASGGVAPYTWQRSTSTIDCSGCPLGTCIPFICPGVTVTTWTTFSTSATATPPGTFPIRVTDSQGNTITLTSATGLAPCTTCPNITTTVTSQTNIDCVTPTGSATVSASGGASPYTYNWSPGNLNGATQSGLAAGTYTVITTDAGTCKDTITLTITSSGTPPSVTATATPTTCGLNNGTATATGTGVPPITYQWLPVGTIAQTITNLAPGDYVVVITDGSGCSAAGGDTVTVAASSGFTTAVSTTPSVCTANNGTATATNTGGTGPFTYSWSPSGGNGATASNLAPGTYTVQVTDAQGCTATASGTVTQSSGTLALSLTNPVNPTCAGNDGSITAGLSGGTAPYTVTIDTGGTPIVVSLPFAISQTVGNLPDGTVTVTVVDAQGCQVINSATLTAPNCCTFTISAAITQPTCAQSNGEIAITPANGSGNYTYVWSPNVGTGSTVSNLAAGTYNVTITDNGFANCFIDTSFVLNSNSSLLLSLTNPVDPTCAGNDGSITVGLSGGTAPYTVTIDTGGGTPIVVSVPFAISQTVNGLPDGTVNVTVVDADGCQVNNSATLNAPNCCSLTISATITQPTCAQSNGEIAITPANGSGNYTYVWSPNVGTGSTVSNLAAGTYNVTITDNGFANCFVDTFFTLNSNSSLLLSLTNPVDPTCAGNDGSITVGLSGGTAPYTVTIDTGGGTPIVVSVPFAISQTVNGLPDGTVNVSVVDADGCQVNNSATLNAPNCCSLTISAATIQPTCAQSNGEIAITPANGSGNYTYVWSPNVGTGSTVSNLAAGTYNVTITDNGFANCFIDTSFVLNSNSSLLLSLTNPVNPTCAGNDGSITVGLSGGTAPYTVTIDTGGGTPIVINLPFAINQTFNGLPDGTVNVTVVDADGCQVNNSATLTAPANCCTFTISAVLTNPACGVSDGSIAIAPANGSGSYTYVWNPNVSTGSTASNLAAGAYAVTITDPGFANCFIDTIFNLVNPNAPAITLASQTDVVCNGDATGSITVQVSGGTAPIITEWNTGDTGLTVSGLASGTYTVTVTDANNCVANASYTITEPSAINLLMSATAIDCTDPLSGSAEVTASGGTPPYTYLWNNAATTSTLTNVEVGTYTVTVTDAEGCTAIDSMEVTGDIVSSFNLGPDQNICFGDTLYLGTGLAGTVWSTGDTSDYLLVTEGGTYWGAISSGNCSNSDTITVFVEQIPTTPELNVYDTIVCENETLILLVGDEGYLYVWNTGDTASQVIVDTPGIYVVTAINECGEVSAEALVTDENCACRLYMPNAFSPNGDGANDVYKAYTLCTEVEGYTLSIFDRWGGLVYKSNDLNEVWDGTSKGKLCTPGVYVFNLSYLSRENGIRQIHRQKGSVTLLR